MKSARFWFVSVLTQLLIVGWLVSFASLAKAADFSFGVIAHTLEPTLEDTTLRAALAESDADNLAFVVISGIKSSSETCSDELLMRRRRLFEQAKNGIIVSIAGSDWSICRAEDGQSRAIERLNRIRDLYYGSDFSFGSSKLPLARQARIPKFRTYSENLRWEVDGVMFATVNLPADNNRYQYAAGQNGEFDDRMIANRAWIHRLFLSATQRESPGIVLFVDGNPLVTSHATRATTTTQYRDGFIEVRKQIEELAQRFPGKIMLIHGPGAGKAVNKAAKNVTSNVSSNATTQQSSNGVATTPITWQGNIATLPLSSGWQKITVDSNIRDLFSISARGLQSKPTTP